MRYPCKPLPPLQLPEAAELRQYDLANRLEEVIARISSASDVLTSRAGMATAAEQLGLRAAQVKSVFFTGKIRLFSQAKLVHPFLYFSCWFVEEWYRMRLIRVRRPHLPRGDGHGRRTARAARRTGKICAFSQVKPDYLHLCFSC